jgi:hypothetical protein
MHLTKATAHIITLLNRSSCVFAFLVALLVVALAPNNARATALPVAAR